MKHSVRVLCSIVGLCLCTTAIIADSYRLTKIKPEQSIVIGGRTCNIGDTFNDEEIIEWNSELSIQAFQAVCIEHPSKRIEVSKGKVRKITEQNVSYKTLVGLFSKGEGDYYTLWEGDTLKIDVANDDTYLYRLRYYDTYERINLEVRNNQVLIPWNLLKGRKDVIKCYIDRIDKRDKYDIEIVDSFEVELII